LPSCCIVDAGILSVNLRHICLIDLVSAKLIDIVSQPHQTMFQYTDTAF